MEQVVIAVGSNLGDRILYLRKATDFLELLSERSVDKSSIWESEAVGPAQYSFLNGVARVTTELPPVELLEKLKSFEYRTGREKNPVRWGPRILDLDIVTYGNLVVQEEGLIIPHPEYKNRTFVLYPLQEIEPDWHDPVDHTPIDRLIENAPEIEIKKTDYQW